MSKHIESRASRIAQLVKNPPAVQETWVRFLGWEDLLEKGKATHSSVLGKSWEIPWPKVPGGLQSMGSPVGRDLATKQTAVSKVSINKMV